jgi:hypothetical protein
MTHDELIQTWIDYCRQVLPDEWTITREEETSGRDAPRPPKPYLTLKIISGPRQLTMDDELRFNGNSTGNRNYNLVGQRAYTISFKAYGEGYVDALHDLSMGTDDPDLNEFLKTTGDIAVTNRGNVSDISGLLETGFERRASLDIIFNSSHNKETGIGLIETVKITGELDERELDIPEINKGA